jgi:hypothetical protein
MLIFFFAGFTGYTTRDQQCTCLSIVSSTLYAITFSDLNIAIEVTPPERLVALGDHTFFCKRGTQEVLISLPSGLLAMKTLVVP